MDREETRVHRAMRPRRSFARRPNRLALASPVCHSMPGRLVRRVCVCVCAGEGHWGRQEADWVVEDGRQGGAERRMNGLFCSSSIDSRGHLLGRQIEHYTRQGALLGRGGGFVVGWEWYRRYPEGWMTVSIRQARISHRDQ